MKIITGSVKLYLILLLVLMYNINFVVIITQICKKGVLIVVEQLRVIFEVIFCAESKSELRVGLSRQDFEIFEVMYTKNGFFGYFWNYARDAEYFFAVFYLFHHLVLSLPFKMRSRMVLYDFSFISYGHFNVMSWKTRDMREMTMELKYFEIKNCV